MRPPTEPAHGHSVPTFVPLSHLQSRRGRLLGIEKLGGFFLPLTHKLGTGTFTSLEPELFTCVAVIVQVPRLGARLVVAAGLHGGQLRIESHAVCLDVDGGLGVASTLRVGGRPVVLTMRAWRGGYAAVCPALRPQPSLWRLNTSLHPGEDPRRAGPGEVGVPSGPGAAVPATYSDKCGVVAFTYL